MGVPKIIRKTMVLQAASWNLSLGAQSRMSRAPRRAHQKAEKRPKCATLYPNKRDWKVNKTYPRLLSSRLSIVGSTIDSPTSQFCFSLQKEESKTKRGLRQGPVRHSAYPWLLPSPLVFPQSILHQVQLEVETR